MAVMPPLVWAVGLALLIAVAVLRPNPVILIIAILGATETWRLWRARRSDDPEQRAYYAVSPRARLAIGLVYIGLAAALAFGMDATHLVRTFADA